MRGVPSGSFDRSSSITGRASGVSFPRMPTYISRPSTYSSIRMGASNCSCSQSIRSINSLMDDTTALNSMPIEPSSHRFHDDRKVKLVGKRQAPAERTGEDGCMDAVEGEDLFRDALVLRE